MFKQYLLLLKVIKFGIAILFICLSQNIYSQFPYYTNSNLTPEQMVQILVGAGVEFSDSIVRAVEVFGSEKFHRVTAIGTVDISDNVITNGVLVNTEAAAAVLKELWEKYSFKAKEVIFGVDNKYVLVRYADIKNSDEKKFGNDVKDQIQEYLPVDKNSVETDFLPLDETVDDDGNKTTKTLIVAAGKKMLGDYIEVFKDCKLKIEDIDINTLALSRLIPEDVLSQLESMNITAGIKHDIIRRMCESDRPMNAVVISEATKPQVGEKARIETYIEYMTEKPVYCF